MLKKSMFYRQKILLALIESFGGRLNKLDLQKYLFLFAQKCQQDKSYDFVPYKFGCFSFQSYADRRNLIDAGCLAVDDDWQLKGTGYLNSITKGDKEKIINFQKYYTGTSGDDLIREVYKNYPYYAINSEIANRLLNSIEMKKIEESRPMCEDYCFFTIGYEGQSFENYLNRLIRNNIKILCDVRKNPLSRKYGFSRQTLSETLKKLGIGYVHIPDLGIVSEKRQELNTQADYDRLFDDYERTTLKASKNKLEELLRIFQENKRIAITCFEAHHCMCHRGRVAKAMTEMPGWEYPIQHI